MKTKFMPVALCLAAILFCSLMTSAEARHHRHSHTNFSLNIGSFLPVPAPCVQERVVVEQYYPYAAPVYVYPQPYAPPVYVRPAPCYREVIVAAPRPIIRPGFSFSWNSRR